jgi:hypothetical protein
LERAYKTRRRFAQPIAVDIFPDPLQYGAKSRFGVWATGLRRMIVFASGDVMHSDIHELFPDVANGDRSARSNTQTTFKVVWITDVAAGSLAGCSTPVLRIAFHAGFGW